MFALARGTFSCCGAGVNPLGDEALEKLPQWWLESPCSEFQSASEANQI